jgi:hypothetical protein
VEVVHRPLVDPSLSDRELDRLVPPDHPGRDLGVELIETMQDRFGSPPGGDAVNPPSRAPSPRASPNR